MICKEIRKWIWFSGWGYGKVDGRCEHGDELTGLIKCRVFLISLLLKEDYTPYSNFFN
jgi:hypothetical protein